MIRKLFVGATLAGMMTLGTGLSALAQSPSEQNPPEKSNRQEQQATKSVSGKVTNIGNGGHSFSLEVAGGNKGAMEFVVDKNTQVNGQVKEGTAVTVEYQANAGGQNLAVSITAQA